MGITFIPFEAPAAPKARSDEGFYVSASSARHLASETLTKWLPYIDGPSSPLGPGGPLSANPGVGTTTVDGPSEFIAEAAASEQWQHSEARQHSADFFELDANPLGAQGPLSGESVGRVAAQILASTEDSAQRRAKLAAMLALQAGGPLAIAGRSGINNAAGWMGPLGPTGAFATQGLTVNLDTGDYVDAFGAVVTHIERVKWQGAESRRLPLVEHYREPRARQLSNEGRLDASWMVESTIPHRASTAFTFEAPAGQLLNLLVLSADADAAASAKPGVPRDQLSDFDLEVLDAQGALLANSIQSDGTSDWIQLYNPRARQLTVRVTLKAQAIQNNGTGRFRLLVDTATDKVQPRATRPYDRHRMPLRTVAVETE